MKAQLHHDEIVKTRSDKQLMEEAITTMANENTRALAKALVAKVVRQGFKQYRKVNEGWLYGSGTYRFMIPYSVVNGVASPSFISKLDDKFEKVRAARDAEYGRPKDLEHLHPVQNPEDLLKEEETGDLGGGPPGEGAPEGSTPSTPATETERSEPDVASVALEGSTPSGLPNPSPETGDTNGGETTMAVKRRKDGKRMPDPWTCPKCGETFGAPGRHAASCTGKAPARRASRRSAPEQADAGLPEVVINPTLNGHNTSIEKFEAALTVYTKASADLLAYVKTMHGEMQIYRRENEELRAFKQRASALFEPSSRVPRG